MVKILRYIDRKLDKRSGFSRAEAGDEEVKEKGSKKHPNVFLPKMSLINL